MKHAHDLVINVERVVTDKYVSDIPGESLAIPADPEHQCERGHGAASP